MHLVRVSEFVLVVVVSFWCINLYFSGCCSLVVHLLLEEVVPVLTIVHSTCDTSYKQVQTTSKFKKIYIFFVNKKVSE